MLCIDDLLPCSEADGVCPNAGDIASHGSWKIGVYEVKYHHKVTGLTIEDTWRVELGGHPCTYYLFIEEKTFQVWGQSDNISSFLSRQVSPKSDIELPNELVWTLLLLSIYQEIFRI